MENYKISEDAKTNLKRIYIRGLNEYGEAKADEYYAAFFTRFELISRQPYLYQSVDHIRKATGEVFAEQIVYITVLMTKL